MNRKDTLSEAYQTMRLNPLSIDDLYQAVRRQHQAGNWTAAIEFCRRILSMEPCHAPSFQVVGVIAHQRGDNVAAIKLIARAVLVDATVAAYQSNLCIVMRALGRMKQAVFAARSAIVLEPALVAAYGNSAKIAADGGGFDEEARCYRRSLYLDPKFTDAYFGFGQVQKKLGQSRNAAACYFGAIALNPDYAEAYSNLADVQAGLDQPERAVRIGRRAVLLMPLFPEAYFNIGLGQRLSGRFAAGRNSFRAAIAIKPHLAEALYDLSVSSYKLGHREEALTAVCRCLLLKESVPAKVAFSEYLKGQTDKNHLGVVADFARRALIESWTRPNEIGGAIIKMILLNPRIAQHSEEKVVAASWSLERHDCALADLAGDPFLAPLLRLTPIHDLSLERMLTACRRMLLNRAMDDVEGLVFNGQVLEFCCALAEQCFINEYVFYQSDDEANLVAGFCDQIANALIGHKAVAAMHLVALACYMPLYSLAQAQSLLSQQWPNPIQDLVDLQIASPLRERTIRETIPQLTPIDDSVSRVVRQQYEDHPYPRWIKLGAFAPRIGIIKYLQNLFPFAPLFSFDDSAPAVLVAGCGTGQQPIETAMRMPSAQVLAIDLSLASLSYGARKAQEIGITNLRFAQADILELGCLEQRFDVIESVGVLHHLGDPEAGLRVLLSLLTVNGLMKLGFYSAFARQGVVAAQDFIHQRGYASESNGIRQFRRDLMDLDESDLAKSVQHFRDFASTSECRDLVFHVQEQCFTLPDIKVWLERYRLVFLGFQCPPEVFSRFKECFQQDGTERNLDCWHLFEQDNPHIFTGMYQFWVQRATD